MTFYTKNLSSQAYAHIFSANFALDCVKNPCRAASPPADFCLVLDKIMLENPHTFLVKTGSKHQLKTIQKIEHDLAYMDYAMIFCI